MTVDIRSSDPTLPRFGTDFIATVRFDQHTNGALPVRKGGLPRGSSYNSRYWRSNQNRKR